MKKLQVIVSHQHDPYLNLAVETYLTDHQEEGMVTMYLWRNERTVVIGLNQNPFTECDVKRLNDEGGHLMRRRTGGGAVYHDLGNLNFSFIADHKHYDVTKQLSVVQNALRQYGLETAISGRNDLTYQGRKFSGNAFFSGTDNNLHHGTILIKTDSEMMQRYLTVNKAKLTKNGVKSVASRVINLSEAVPELNSENIVKPLIHAFETVYGKQPDVADFQLLSSRPEVHDIREHITSHQYLYGKWEHFQATKQGQFPWGAVAVNLNIDTGTHTIRDITIASDSLDTEVIHETERLLKGHDSITPPQSDNSICNDIINLIYA